MNLNPHGAQDVEQVAAGLLSCAITAAHDLADLAVQDDRYDQLAALAAAAYASQASCYLPLSDASPADMDGGIGHHDLIHRVDAVADALDELGRSSTDLREMRDHHTAALHARNAAIALRNALPVEEGADDAAG
ncbi:hypothetical protein [Kitasatospora sp. SUK 42]|uniref:hypothetical protein n=1 Tax=Kitasatospora sp. SUK 42 TaxID=1588882 RepID=UPI0018CBA233|nr:hypothetical protein [Kitasatospora sp. SUK 42]MBV2155064.1 hypothetical protein [Kitasatospora sp. SUK 42]